MSAGLTWTYQNVDHYLYTSTPGSLHASGHRSVLTGAFLQQGSHPQPKGLIQRVQLRIEMV